MVLSDEIGSVCWIRLNCEGALCAKLSVDKSTPPHSFAGGEPFFFRYVIPWTIWQRIFYAMRQWFCLYGWKSLSEGKQPWQTIGSLQWEVFQLLAAWCPFCCCCAFFLVPARIFNLLAYCNAGSSHKCKPDHAGRVTCLTASQTLPPPIWRKVGNRFGFVLWQIPCQRVCQAGS